jgi:hypothetical protein
MIAKGVWRNNEPDEVVHRFHKRESCVFHSIHRLLSSLGEALSSTNGSPGPAGGPRASGME